MMSKSLLATYCSYGAYTITLGSTLIGGHLTMSYLFLRPMPIFEIYLNIILAVIGINLVYFLIMLCLQLTGLPLKKQLRNATLGMLWNIPIAVVYLFILIAYEF